MPFVPPLTAVAGELVVPAATRTVRLGLRTTPGQEALVRRTAEMWHKSLLSQALPAHWFMLLPLPSEKLWDWGMRSRAPDA